MSKVGIGGFEDLDDPDYDFLDPLYEAATASGDDDNDLKKPGKSSSSQSSTYILGTLLVRVVAARNLKRQHGGMINPYASIKFAKQTQRTSDVFDSKGHPTWPRGEISYMDVALPLNQVTHQQDDVLIGEEELKTTVTVALFHSNDAGVAKLSQKAASLQDPPTKGGDGDSDDEFLGMTTLDVTALLTGKYPQIDTWFSLSGIHVESRSSFSLGRVGSVRVVCEYEPTDPPPRSGDVVRLTRFCHPKDLFPVPPSASYRVHHVEDDHVVLSYKTIEGWQCSFQVHRYMLLCEQRYQGAIEYYQDELTMRTERFTQSIVAREVQRSVEKAHREGIFCVGVEAVQGGIGLLGRWFNEGLDTAVSDIVSTTNWDGQHQVEQDHTGDSELERKPAAQPKSPDGSETESSGAKALPGMPSCPITGFPMMDPVVAADGHTYERSAIARWLKTSGKSPLTGEVLIHKELAPNYMLLSSLQERKNDGDDKKMPPSPEGDKKPSAAAPVAIVTTDLVSDAGVSYPTLSTLDGALGDTEDTPDSSVANPEDVGRMDSITTDAIGVTECPGPAVEEKGVWHPLERPTSIKSTVPTEGIADEVSSSDPTGNGQNTPECAKVASASIAISEAASEVSDTVTTAAAGGLAVDRNNGIDGGATTEGSVSTVTLATNAPLKVKEELDRRETEQDGVRESVRPKSFKTDDESKQKASGQTTLHSQDDQDAAFPHRKDCHVEEKVVRGDAATEANGAVVVDDSLDEVVATEESGAENAANESGDDDEGATNGETGGRVLSEAATKSGSHVDSEKKYV